MNCTAAYSLYLPIDCTALPMHCSDAYALYRYALYLPMDCTAAYALMGCTAAYALSRCCL